jgi:hypothetical protein
VREKRHALWHSENFVLRLMRFSQFKISCGDTRFDVNKVRVVELRVHLKLPSVVNITFMASSVVFKSRLHLPVLLLVEPSSVSIDLAELVVVRVIEAIVS